MPIDASGRMVSDDGRWYWDGRQWQLTVPPEYHAWPASPPIVPKARSTSAWRTGRHVAEGLIALVLVGVLVFSSLQVLQANWLLTSQVESQKNDLARHQTQIGALQAEVQDLKERWFGSPALWRPPTISNTDVKFFAVSGSTQQDLIYSLNSANLCKKYGGCAPDPGAPNGVAWGLESFRPASPTYVCYSPRTTTLAFREYIVIPRWSPPTDGTVSVTLVGKWNALEKVIYTHEAGHVAITKRDLAALNNQAHHLPSCPALIAFWAKPSVFNKLTADQNAYHARLRADCRPEIGCFTGGWMGW